MSWQDQQLLHLIQFQEVKVQAEKLRVSHLKAQHSTAKLKLKPIALENPLTQLFILKVLINYNFFFFLIKTLYYSLHSKLLDLFWKLNFLMEHHLMICLLNKTAKVFKITLRQIYQKIWNTKHKKISYSYFPKLVPSNFWSFQKPNQISNKVQYKL